MDYMKQLLLPLIFSAATIIAAETPLFSGIWCVEDEGISLTFVDDTTVTFSSEDDETVGGEGVYSFDDSTLTASVDNEGMLMEIEYAYTVVEDEIEIITTAMTLNGDAMEVGDDVMIMVRCNSEENETENEEK